MLVMKGHVLHRSLEQGSDLGECVIGRRRVLWTKRSHKLRARLKEGKDGSENGVSGVGQLETSEGP